MNNVRHVSGNMEIKLKQKTTCSFLKLTKWRDDCEKNLCLQHKKRWQCVQKISVHTGGKIACENSRSLSFLLAAKRSFVRRENEARSEERGLFSKASGNSPSRKQKPNEKN